VVSDRSVLERIQTFHHCLAVARINDNRAQRNQPSASRLNRLLNRLPSARKGVAGLAQEAILLASSPTIVGREDKEHTAQLVMFTANRCKRNGDNRTAFVCYCSAARLFRVLGCTAKEIDALFSASASARAMGRLEGVDCLLHAGRAVLDYGLPANYRANYFWEAGNWVSDDHSANGLARWSYERSDYWRTRYDVIDSDVELIGDYVRRRRGWLDIWVRPKEAIKALADIREQFKERGSAVGEMNALSSLVTALMLDGQRTAARALIEDASGCFNKGTIWNRLTLHVLYGQLLEWPWDREKALQHFRKALDLYNESGCAPSRGFETAPVVLDPTRLPCADLSSLHAVVAVRPPLGDRVSEIYKLALELNCEAS
jgi:tetratricopeptide (TPR) repeat protein